MTARVNHFRVFSSLCSRQNSFATASTCPRSAQLACEAPRRAHGRCGRNSTHHVRVVVALADGVHTAAALLRARGHVHVLCPQQSRVAALLQPLGQQRLGQLGVASVALCVRDELAASVGGRRGSSSGSSSRGGDSSSSSSSGGSGSRAAAATGAAAAPPGAPPPATAPDSCCSSVAPSPAGCEPAARRRPCVRQERAAAGERARARALVMPACFSSKRAASRHSGMERGQWRRPWW